MSKELNEDDVLRPYSDSIEIHLIRSHVKPPEDSVDESHHRKMLLEIENKVNITCKECSMDFSHLHNFLVHLHHKTKNKHKNKHENEKVLKEEDDNFSNSFSPHFDNYDDDDADDDNNNSHDHCTSKGNSMDKPECESGITRCEFCPKTRDELELESRFALDPDDWRKRQRQKVPPLSSFSHLNPAFAASSSSSSLVCPGCSKSFSNQTYLRQHLMATIIDNFKMRCPSTSVRSCKRLAPFIQSCAYEQHMKNSHESEFGSKFYICPFAPCTKSFDKLKYLKSHESRHHNETEEDFLCTVCGAALQSSQNLRVHMKKHEDEASNRIWTCPHPACGKNYNNSIDYKRHLRKHEETKAKFKCSFEGCGKFFQARKNRDTHEISHTSVKSHKCPQIGCPAEFKHFKSLTDHVLSLHCETKGDPSTLTLKIDPSFKKKLGQVEWKAKTFVCGVCGKIYLKSGNYKAHMAKHDGVKPFGCSRCSATFFRADSARKHEEKCQESGELFPCTFCGENFSILKIFQKHVAAHKKVEKNKDKSNKKEMKIKNIKRNSKKTPKTSAKSKTPGNFICDVLGCAKTFIRERNLLQHLKTHEDGNGSSSENSTDNNN